jgi:hypothetical protein
MDGIGAYLQTGTRFFKCRSLLEYFRALADARQGKARGKAGDAAAGNEEGQIIHGP